MMYDHEKSDPAIVALKPTNKAGQPAAELVEPRAGAKGNASPGLADDPEAQKGSRLPGIHRALQSRHRLRAERSWSCRKHRRFGTSRVQS